LQAKKGRISRREKRLQTANLSSQMRRELAQKMKEETSDIGRERIISEILDAANTKSLLSQLDCTGYVLSSRLVSNYISQVAENADLNAVFSEILEHKGNEFFLRFVQDYLDTEVEPELSFWDVLLRVRDHGEILIGYKTADEPFAPFDADGAGMKNLCNPADKRKPRRWRNDDVLIVIAPVARERTRKTRVDIMAPKRGQTQVDEGADGGSA